VGAQPGHAGERGELMEIFMMGKYSVHIWSSFGITAVVIVICVLQARWRQQSVLHDIRTRIEAMESEQ
jgi:heme exporter protein CcmD